MADSIFRRWDPINGVWPATQWPPPALASADPGLQAAHDSVVDLYEAYIARTGYAPRELWLSRRAEKDLATRAYLLAPQARGRVFRDICPCYAGMWVHFDSTVTKVKSRFAVAAGKDTD